MSHSDFKETDLSKARRRFLQGCGYGLIAGGFLIYMIAYFGLAPPSNDSAKHQFEQFLLNSSPIIILIGIGTAFWFGKKRRNR